MLNNKVLVFTCLSIAALQLSQVAATAAGNSHKSTKGSSHRSRSNNYYLVPPPPPVPVSPAILAAYGRSMGGPVHSMHFIPSKPRTVVEDMKLTAVMDDVAFFQLHSNEGSVHLRKGGTYQNVTVAQINPAEVVLEEKGKQFIKHLQ